MTVGEISTLIAAVTSAVVAIGTVAISWRNAGKIDSVHAMVNGQSSRIEALAIRTGNAEGHSEAAAAKAAAPTAESTRP